MNNDFSDSHSNEPSLATMFADDSVSNINNFDYYNNLVYFTRTSSKSTLKRHTHKTIQCRCYKAFNEDNFLNELAHILSSFNISQSNSNQNIFLTRRRFL